MNDLTNFETDYIVSWDFCKPDFPCVRILALSRDKERGTDIIVEDIGRAYTETGVVSLRQLLAIHNERKRLEEAQIGSKDDTREEFCSLGERKEKRNA